MYVRACCSVLAHMTDKKFSVRFQNINVVSAYANNNVFVMIFRFGGVKVFSINTNLSVSISPAGFIPAYIEWFCWKRQKVYFVFLKQLGDLCPLLIMVFFCLLLVLIKK